MNTVASSVVSGRYPDPSTGSPVASTEEVVSMSPKDKATQERKVKTLAIRLYPELHAHLSVIAQLSASTITDEIRDALSAHVATKASGEDLAGAAAELLEEIERDAATRREALAGLLGQPSAETTKPARRTSGRTKTTTEDNSADS